MKSDDLYRHLKFSSDFSVDDWNALLTIKFRPYFRNENIFDLNKEVLRTEFVNYIRFSEKPEYLNLFNWTFLIFKECFEKDESLSIKQLTDSFEEITETDSKWMTNAIIQPNPSNFSERDKACYYFKALDDILEGAFLPRFKLFDNFINYYIGGKYYDNSKIDFGQIVQNFPNSVSNYAGLYLQDPIFSISTNQWRNISAHKTFEIKKDSIRVEYGKKNVKSLTINYSQLKQILDWAIDIYRVLRLAEVFINLNFTEEVVKALGGTKNMKLRFESVLLHLIHNIQIVGFEFIETKYSENKLILCLKKKIDSDLKVSIVHASQFLEHLSSAVYFDEFTRDKYSDVKVEVIDETNKQMASVSVKIDKALSKLENRIGLKEYLQSIEFEIQNFA